MVWKSQCSTSNGLEACDGVLDSSLVFLLSSDVPAVPCNPSTLKLPPAKHRHSVEISLFLSSTYNFPVVSPIVNQPLLPAGCFSRSLSQQNTCLRERRDTAPAAIPVMHQTSLSDSVPWADCLSELDRISISGKPVISFSASEPGRFAPLCK